MTRDPLPDDFLLTEEQFREIIERATRDPSQGDAISLNVLRQVAAEMQIDPVALERAVGAVVSAPAAPPSSQPPARRSFVAITRAIDRFLPHRSRWLFAAAVGAFLGWVSASATLALQTVIDGVAVSLGSSSSTDFRVGAALVLMTLANSLSRRATGDLGRYVAETLAMWGAFGLFWVVAFGAVTTDVQTFVATSARIALVWGWFVVPAGGPGQVASSSERALFERASVGGTGA